MKEAEELKLLKIVSISIIADYSTGWRDDFKTIDEAVAYVMEIPATVENPDTPLHLIGVRLDFGGGQEERAVYSEKERIVAWLGRFRE